MDNETLEALAKRLAEHTGITIQEAREIVRLIGADWPSLVREAKAVKR